MDKDFLKALFDKPNDPQRSSLKDNPDVAIFRDLSKSVDEKYGAFLRIMSAHELSLSSPNISQLYIYAIHPTHIAILKKWGLDINAKIKINNMNAYSYHELIEDRPSKWIGALANGYDLNNKNLVPTGGTVWCDYITDPDGIHLPSGELLFSYKNKRIDNSLALTDLIEGIFMFNLSISKYYNEPLHIAADVAFQEHYPQFPHAIPTKYIKDVLKCAVLNSSFTPDVRKYIPLLKEIIAYSYKDNFKVTLLRTIEETIEERFTLPYLKELFEVIPEITLHPDSYILKLITRETRRAFDQNIYYGQEYIHPAYQSIFTKDLSEIIEEMELPNTYNKKALIKYIDILQKNRRELQ